MTTGESPPSLEAIGFDDHFQAELARLEGDFRAARVAIAHGQSYVLWTVDGPRTGILVGRRAADWKDPLQRPQVGDWVAAVAMADGTWIIEHVLTRQTCLVRMAAGTRVVPQVLAANVDVVGVVSALGEGSANQRRLINEERLERYLAAVEQSGASPLLIVNKADLSDSAQLVVDSLAARFSDVPVVLACATHRDGLEGVATWLQPGKTLGLVGMSGVGKSTLVNTLLNREAQRTGGVREADARGRHTTTHRELFLLDSGALLLDMPGTREFAVWGEDEKTEHLRGQRRSQQLGGRTR